jgi:hypothetical protein
VAAHFICSPASEFLTPKFRQSLPICGHGVVTDAIIGRIGAGGADTTWPLPSVVAASHKHRDRIEIDRKQRAHRDRLKGTGDALPNRPQAVVEEGRALIKEVKGLSGDEVESLPPVRVLSPLRASDHRRVTD